MKIVGLMSGTSADGIDAALCEVAGTPPQLAAHIVIGISRPFKADFQQRILEACQPQTSRVNVLCRLNYELAEMFAEATLDVIAKAGLKPSDVDLVGSHGQTVWHDVRADGSVGATLQLVESAVLAEHTGITTISNFRARDVTAGGQGAPLTGYVDYLLLRHVEHWRAVQNIGGMGNVTFLPPLSEGHSQPIAFDTGPGNVLIDAIMHRLTDGKSSYDRDGQMAKAGRVASAWLENLLEHPYFARGIPKTTGRELFSVEMAQQLLETGRTRGLSGEDVIATITALTAYSIADAYQRFAPSPIGEMILGGGGRRNPAIVEHLRALLQPTQVLTHEDVGLDSDLKEALVFAVLAHETWHNRPGSLPALTGAKHPVILGQITPGTNYRALIQRTWSIQ